MKITNRAVPYTILTLLLGAGVVMLLRAPVRGYAVTCQRTTAVSCVLERTEAAGTQRWQVPLEANASATVRIVPGRRSGPRVFLYLEMPARSVFAAEFEGGDAADSAYAAAERVNKVLRGTAQTAHVEAVPPPYLRWLAWGGLGVMGLLILAGVGEVLRERRGRPERFSGGDIDMGAVMHAPPGEPS